MQIGFTGLLALLFIGLKLAGYIAWSWLWVLSPLWIGLAVWLVILGAVLCYAEWVARRPKTPSERIREEYETMRQVSRRYL